MITVSISGDKKLAAKLGQIENGLKGELLEKALVSGALLVANDAKIRVPKKSGNLARSIHVGGGNGGLEGDTTGTDIGGAKHSGGNAEVRVGTNVAYGRIVEFGSGRRAPKPYLRPAADANQDAVVAEVAAALKDLLGAL
jgi:HK97 gp10 family phage protein